MTIKNTHLGLLIFFAIAALALSGCAPALAEEIIHLPIVGRAEAATPTPSPTDAVQHASTNVIGLFAQRAKIEFGLHGAWKQVADIGR